MKKFVEDFITKLKQYPARWYIKSNGRIVVESEWERWCPLTFLCLKIHNEGLYEFQWPEAGKILGYTDKQSRIIADTADNLCSSLCFCPELRLELEKLINE